MTTITAPPVVDQESRGVLPVMLAATFMTAVDFFIVNVALPAMQHDLHAGPSALQWVIAGFGLALGTGLITSGRSRH
jgi:MFS family permease